MNKELEALVLIAAHIGLLEELTDLKKGSVVEELHLLENALTRLEKLEKVIEIIKTKLVDFSKLDYAINCDKSVLYFIGEKLSRCEKYNLSKTDDYALTEEEFNLLKELFGNE